MPAELTAGDKDMRLILGLLLLASTACADVATFCMGATNGQTMTTSGRKQVSRSERLRILQKLGAHGQDVHIIVTDDKVPATALIELIHDMQKSGLRRLVLICAGQLGGKEGTYQITVDSTQNTFGTGLGGIIVTSGFHAVPPISWEKIQEALEDIGKDLDDP
jgi:hypothetical protein